MKSAHYEYFTQNTDFGLKLIDFGLAKQLKNEENGVKISKLQGTIGRNIYHFFVKVGKLAIALLLIR